MTPSTLFTLIAFITLISGITATTTNYSLATISPYIITHIPISYTTINGDEGFLTMTEFHYTNTTCEIPTIDAPVSIENMLYNISYQICELMLYILSYRYIINYICFMYNIYNRSIKFIDSIDTEPVPMPTTPMSEPEPVYELPNVNIKETIINDCEDDYDNCNIYKTSKYEMSCYYSNEIKIDDIVFNGECYIESNIGYLFSNNFKPIKFNNLTYKQLLMIATLSPFTEKEKNIDVTDVSIKEDKKYDNIQIITINYN
jgi:hypothetical protein